MSTWDQTIWLRKIYFHSLVEKGVSHFQGLFLETRILWNSYILKRFIFLSLNMVIWQVSRPTVIDFKVWERHSQIEGSSSRIPKGIDDLIKVLDASRLLTLRSLCPWVFENFLVSALDRPFLVFTLESRFFFHFLFFSLIIPSCTRKFKIRPQWLNDLSRWFWLKVETITLLTMKNSLRKTSSV